MSKQNNNKKSKKSAPVSGNLTIKVHAQLNVSLDNVNIRKIDVAIIPSNFDIFNRYAATYQRYKITSGNWKFYSLRNVNAIQTPVLPIYPIIVY